MASWFDRLKQLKRRAGLDLITGAALMLFVSGSQALAEDEPTAKAPLPPLLGSAPAEAGQPRMPDSAPSRNPSDPRAPALSFDRSRSQLSQKKPRLHSTSDHGASVAKKRETVERRRNHSKDAVAHRQGHRTVASEKRQGRDRSSAEPGIGQLSPPSDYPDPRIGSASKSPPEPRQAAPLYYPNYFSGPPAYGYAPSYPYAWVPPGPGVFR